MSNGHYNLESIAKAVDISSSEMASADAQAALAEALIISTIQFNQKGFREAVFLELYCGEWGVDFVRNNVMKKKVHQTPGALKKMVEAIKALSLSEFMRGVNLNLGGK